MRKHTATIGIASVALGAGMLSAPSAAAQPATAPGGIGQTVAEATAASGSEYRPCKRWRIYLHKHYTKRGKAYWHVHKRCVKRDRDNDRKRDRDRY